MNKKKKMEENSEVKCKDRFLYDEIITIMKYFWTLTMSLLISPRREKPTIHHKIQKQKKEIENHVGRREKAPSVVRFK